jgi:putative oxidoreductase
METIDRICADWSPRVLSVLRFMTGLVFMQHGLTKLVGFPPPANPGPARGFLELGGGLHGLGEALGGLLILLGLFTRPVAFLLSGEMAFAYFMSHAPRNFYPALNGGNLAIMYCFVFLYFAFVGGGAWSLDAVRSRSAAPAHA